jgi:D-alanyl-D-alanine carboxypeptidase
MRELRRNVESQPQQQQPGNQKQQEQQKPSGSGNKDGLLNDAPERGGVLNASQDSEHRAQSSERAAESADKSEGTEVRVSEGTGRSISLGQSRTGLQEAVEAAGKVEGSLV